MSTHNEFASRLKEERRRLNLNQTAFGNACGVGISSQSLYEKGERFPNVDYLLLAAELGVNISYLFGSENASGQPQLNHEALAFLYRRTDDLSRDSKGRLVDLEYRVETFLRLLGNDGQ